ncbi:MAG TPA: PQQ-binding-like beta-propeller repeat protein [Candidatus Tumulicola sp.]
MSGRFRAALGRWPLVASLVCAACSSPARPTALGPSSTHDPSVVRFYSDRVNSWREFRLGGGLNVVVANASLPREAAWRFGAGRDGISSSPVVYRDLVLVAANDRNLYAIDAATGALRWKYLATNQLMAQPVYTGGVAVVAAGNQECVVCIPPDYVVGGTGSNRLAGVNLTTGRERWGQELAGTGMPIPAIVGTNVVHVDGSGTVLALDALTGRYAWNARLPSVFSMSSVVDGHDGRVYVSGTFPTGVYALRANDGTVVWRHWFPKFYQGPGDGPMASTPTLLIGEYLKPLAPGILGWTVEPGSRVEHHIFALAKATGKLRWDRRVAAGIAPTANQSAIPLIYSQRVYEGSPIAPVVSALDVATGHVVWQLRTGGVVRGGIVALDGVLYFGDIAGYLWAVDAANGRVVGRLRTDLKFYVGSPIILNDSLLDGSREGTVVALPLRSIRSAHDPLPSPNPPPPGV